MVCFVANFAVLQRFAERPIPDLHQADFFADSFHTVSPF